MKISLLFALLFSGLLTSCQPAAFAGSGPLRRQDSTVQEVTKGQKETMPYAVMPTKNAINMNSATATSTAAPVTLTPVTSIPTGSATISPSPTSTSETVSTITLMLSVTPTATVEPTATFWPTVTRQVLPPNVASELLPCANRTVSSDLLVFVTQQFALPEYYAPSDLVPLSNYFASDVTRDQELFVRALTIEPLSRMINDMHAAGLQPSILSAYRSYNEQALAWHWWSGQYPDRVAIMSARPGHSEHQLGTTVDFGSPELDHLFHVDFADTAEGIWLAQHAHSYGFTPSFPSNSYPITGFKHEPWHFRYVGQDLAEELHGSGQILTQWQLANQPPPCIP